METNTPNHNPVQRLGWLLLSLILIALDQLSKWYVTEALYKPKMGLQGLGFMDWYSLTPERLPPFNMEITSFFNLVMVWNTGVSFGLMRGQDKGPILLIALASAITLFFLIWLLRTNDKLHGICFAIIIGGALGNMIDRARFGAVIDFLDFHAFGYHWPAFNVADICVVVGVTLLIIASFVFDLRTKGQYRKPVPENK